MVFDKSKIDDNQNDVRPWQPWDIKYSRCHSSYFAFPTFSYWYNIDDHGTVIEIQAEPDGYGGYSWQFYNGHIDEEFLDDHGELEARYRGILESLISYARDKCHFEDWANDQQWVEAENGFFALGYENLDSVGFYFLDSDDVLPIDFEDLPV